MKDLRTYLFVAFCFTLVSLGASCGYCQIASEKKATLKSDSRSVNIVADCNKDLGRFKNIAPGINFVGDKVAKERFMKEVGTGLYRMKIILSDVEKAGSFYTNFPWNRLSKADLQVRTSIMKRAAKGGARFMFQIYGIPRWLSTVPQDDKVILNNLPNYAKYPPKDYEAWKRLVSATVQELTRLLGQGGHYYEVFGEANVGSTWYQDAMPVQRAKGSTITKEVNPLGHKRRRIMDEFCKIYRYTAAGVRSADPDAKIGGAALTQNTWGLFWMRRLLRYIKNNNLPLDFFSWHKYGGSDYVTRLLEKKKEAASKGRLITKDLGKRLNRRLKSMGFGRVERRLFVDDQYLFWSQLDDTAVKFPVSFYQGHAERILREAGFDRRNTEMFLTEWNVGHAGDRRHDTHYGASFVVKTLIDQINAKFDGQSFYSLSPPAVAPKNKRSRAGSQALFPMDGKHELKASFNAFKLFSKLRGKRIAVEDQRNFYSFATMDADTVSLVTTYFIPSDRPDYSGSKSVKLALRNVPFKAYNYKIYLIDKNHSNDHWGADPELQTVEEGKGQGDFEKSMRLSAYAVVMLSIDKEPNMTNSKSGP